MNEQGGLIGVLAVVSYVVFTLLFMGVVRRLLGVRVSFLRTAVATLVAIWVSRPLLDALVGEPVLTVPSVELGLYLTLLGAFTFVVAMVLIVLAELLVPEGTLPGPFDAWRSWRARMTRSGRYVEILRIATRHGLGRFLRGRRHLALGTVAERRDLARSLRRALEDGGVTFVKLGQQLSTRNDLLPRELIDELVQLQDNAAPVDWEVVRGTIATETGRDPGEIFRELDPTPLAAASVAQVHAAVLHDGRKVVVKVQRPGIEEVMRGDLNLLSLGAQVLEASIDELRLVGVTDIIREFEKALLRELDFREELANLMRMRGLLDPERQVTVPRPYPELSDKTVLTMEFFPGRAVRLLTPESELAIHAVDELLHAICKQVFVDGFFHGDPHAGNILCDEQGRICLLDLGLVGSLTPEQRADIVALMVATFANESATIARILLKMGTPTQRVNLAELRAEIERIRGKYLEDKGVDQLDSSGFVQEFADAAQRFRIKLASEYAILIKSVATLEGIVRKLHPEADVVAIARPYVQQTLIKRFSPNDLMRGFAAELSTIGSVAQRLPEQVDQLMHDFETGNLQVRVVTPTLNQLPQVVHHSASRISLSLFASVMTLCCAIVLPSSREDTVRVVLSVLLGLIATGAWTILLAWHFVRGQPLRLTPLLKILRRG